MYSRYASNHTNESNRALFRPVHKQNSSSAQVDLARFVNLLTESEFEYEKCIREVNEIEPSFAPIRLELGLFSSESTRTR